MAHDSGATSWRLTCPCPLGRQRWLKLQDIRTSRLIWCILVLGSVFLVSCRPRRLPRGSRQVHMCMLFLLPASFVLERPICALHRLFGGEGWEEGHLDNESIEGFAFLILEIRSIFNILRAVGHLAACLVLSFIEDVMFCENVGFVWTF